MVSSDLQVRGTRGSPRLATASSDLETLQDPFLVNIPSNGRNAENSSDIRGNFKSLSTTWIEICEFSDASNENFLRFCFDFNFANSWALWIWLCEVFGALNNNVFDFQTFWLYISEFLSDLPTTLRIFSRFESKFVFLRALWTENVGIYKYFESIFRTFRALQFRMFKFPNALNTRFFISVHFEFKFLDFPAFST